MIKYALLIVLWFSVVYGNDFDWKTKFEKSNYLETCNYNETIEYFNALAVNSEYAKLFKMGKTPQNRDMYYLVVNKDKEFDLATITSSKKSIILIQNGIHSGEIEGKDACLLLLREILITKENESLLDNSILVIIPVINPDGHENSSKYNRINQDGPTNMGWRVTAQNLNLNRDYLKADAPEIKEFVKLYNQLDPDIFIDTHTTDGLDMQPVITYQAEWQGTVPNVLSEWIKKIYMPQIEKQVEDKGFITGYYVNLNDYNDVTKGINGWVSSPKLSSGYAAIRNRVGVLIETHSLKPYKDRVFATKAFIEETIKIANSQNETIKNNTKLADQEVLWKYGNEKENYPLGFKLTKDTVNYLWKGIKADLVNSKITGSKVVKYNGEKYETYVKYLPYLKASKFAKVPKCYIVPQEWTEVINVLKLHGVEYSQINNDTLINCEQYKFTNIKFADLPYEGRFQPTFDLDTIKINAKINKGDYIFNTDQKLIGVLMYLLEPNTNDSFVKWGFFNAVFEQKEYFEEYSMEPIAEEMYNTNESLRKEFDDKVKNDSEFSKNPRARLNFFYEKSEYFDKKFNKYPVLKVY